MMNETTNKCLNATNYKKVKILFFSPLRLLMQLITRNEKFSFSPLKIINAANQDANAKRSFIFLLSKMAQCILRNIPDMDKQNFIKTETIQPRNHMNRAQNKVSRRNQAKRDEFIKAWSDRFNNYQTWKNKKVDWATEIKTSQWRARIWNRIEKDKQPKEPGMTPVKQNSKTLQQLKHAEAKGVNL